MIPGRRRIIAVAAVAMLSASLPAVAQVPTSELPGRERDRFQELQPPRAQPGGPTISLPSTVAPEGAQSIKLILARVRVIGGTVYRIEQIEALYRDLVGHEVTLAEVYDIAQRITAQYGRDGYVLSRAIVPPQELTPGGAVVQIQIIEGYIDKVEWPASLSKYADFFSSYTAKIIADRPTNIRTMERYLLLAADLPGLKFKNSLKPSPSQQGAATLVVEVVEKPLDVLGRVDNRGTKARGPWEYYSSATVNNMLRIHDAFTVNYAGAFQMRELQLISATYRQVLNSEGLTAFVNGSYSWGRPGRPVDPILEYKTKSTVVESGLSYPFIRLRERNLTGTALFFVSDDRGSYFDMPDTAPSSKNRLRGFRVKVDGDAADEFKGINQVNVVFSQGIDGLGSSKNGSDLLTPGNGRVDFGKIEITATRIQQLFANFSLLGAVYGQKAFTPLLSSELCGYGGRVFGRAFDPSGLVGDSCLQLLGELRFDLPVNWLSQAQLYGFADRGWLHNIAPNVGTPVNLDGASVGGGVRLGWQSAITADFSAAKAVAGPRDHWRFFFIATGHY